MPKISVIIPIYNVEKYLRQCLDSIIDQTLEDIEIICIIDGSPDNSINIVKEYASIDNRIIVISQENKGLSASRNCGLKKAMGEYVYFMDSDDILDTQALEYLYKNANEYNLDLLCFDACCFSDDNGMDYIVKKNENYYIRQYDYPVFCMGIEMFSMMSQNNEFRSGVWIQLYRRDYLLKYNFLFHEGVLHEDNSFSILSMVFANKCGYVHKSYFHRRYRKDSIMTSAERFFNSYGYYIAYKDLENKQDMFNIFNTNQQEYIYKMMNRMLINSRNIYARISEKERSLYKKLEFHEQKNFEILVVKPAEIKVQLNEKQRLLQQTYNEKSSINKKLQQTYEEKHERGIKIKELQKELSEKQHEVETLQNELQTIKNSKIWKIRCMVTKLLKKDN